MTKLKQNTWVLVADSEKAFLLENATDHANPYLKVVRKKEQDNPSDLEQSANRPGRMNDSGPGQKSAFDDTDWHELAKDRFASELADLLYGHAHKGNFDDIILVAAPGVLGELRSQMHQEVSDKVVAEIPKTLTNHPLNEIEDIVKAELN
ncbi:Host attachment protein [Loktanella sp. 5RATIMAR09]|uniref:host attachment family protein n=1 Tax=Loktanella sp. 5RATIMAR09 TaxID=1225655 RepID=UPI0006EBA092|nr:host attachment family protein [Loktanella sp. 5RATIMAR09]KQI72762.1 Host attachment protein [Loktanella sp. 5RATIMAR09]